jgi:hypothetical protein
MSITEKRLDGKDPVVVAGIMVHFFFDLAILEERKRNAGSRILC